MKARTLLFTTLLVVMLSGIVTTTTLAGNRDPLAPSGFPLEGKPSEFEVGAKGFHDGCEPEGSCPWVTGWDYYWPDHSNSIEKPTYVLAVIDGFVSPAAEMVDGCPIDSYKNKYLSIANPNWRVGYLHLEECYVSPGDAVKKGQRIGLMGNSGSSDWTHLHFVILHNGEAVRDQSQFWDGSKSNTGTEKEEEPKKEEEEVKPTEEKSVEVKPTVMPTEKEKTFRNIDEMFQAVRIIPGMGKYADAWDKYKKYLPWVAAILVVLVALTVAGPFFGWLSRTKWGQKRDRKRKQFFWLSVLILLAYLIQKDQGKENLLLLEMLKFTFAIWAFFTLTAIIYQFWRHWNYDPEREKLLAAGASPGWEWLWEALIAPVIYGVLVLILAYTFGYYWHFLPKITIAKESVPIRETVKEEESGQNPVKLTPEGSIPNDPNEPTPIPSTPVPLTPALPTPVGECQLSEEWPEAVYRWCELITRYSQKNDLPPDLVAAVIYQESGGDPEAVSGSQACGLMQVVSSSNMMRNMQGLRFFENRPTCERLKDPEYNIEWGTKHLRQRIDGYDKDIRKGLMSYGPVDQPEHYSDIVLTWWKKFAPQSFSDRFIETDGRLK